MFDPVSVGRSWMSAKNGARQQNYEASQKNVSPTICEFELTNLNHLLPQTMATSDLRLEAQIRKLWEIHFVATAEITFFFFQKIG